MAKLKTDSSLSRRTASSCLEFLHSVEPSSEAESEPLNVAKKCLAEVFQIDVSSLDNKSNCNSLVFSSREAVARGVVENEIVSDIETTSLGKAVDVMKDSQSDGHAKTRESVFPVFELLLSVAGKGDLFRHFWGALEKINYFEGILDGNNVEIVLRRLKYMFNTAVEEMQKGGCMTFDPRSLAESFKSQGNKAMKGDCSQEAMVLYTFAIALHEDNAVYYCNRAAAYSQLNLFAEAIQDCLKSIDISPNYTKAYTRLGLAYYSLGKYRDATDQGFIKALQLDPDNDTIKENLRLSEQKLKEQQQNAGAGQG